MTETVLVDGRAQESVSVRDRGFLYGDGLFETIAISRGVPLLWEYHMRRLVRDARRLGIGVPDMEQLRREADHLIAGRERAVLRIVFTRGSGSRGYAAPADLSPTRVVSIADWPSHPSGAGDQGVCVRFCRTRLGRNPALAGIKHLNRLEQVLARAEWENGATEGLMLDDRDRVIEGTMTNVFAVRDGALVTPDLAESGVAGIMRELVLELAALQYTVRVEALTREQALVSDELFLTNSLIGVWPVNRLEGRERSVGPVSRRMQQLLRETGAVA
jgi:4-amino-4-deoxychorismate lyase